MLQDTEPVWKLIPFPKELQGKNTKKFPGDLELGYFEWCMDGALIRGRTAYFGRVQ